MVNNYDVKRIKLKDLLKKFQEMADNRPDSLNFDVIVAITSETDYGCF